MPVPKHVLVLVPEGPARLVAPILAERFARVRCEAGSVLVPIDRRETPEAVLAFCRARRIGVVASCVVARTIAPLPLRHEGVWPCSRSSKSESAPA